MKFNIRTVDPSPPGSIRGTVFVRLPNGQLRPEPDVRVSIFGRRRGRSGGELPIIAETITSTQGDFLASIPIFYDISCGLVAAAKSGFRFDAVPFELARAGKIAQAPAVTIIGQTFTPTDLQALHPSRSPCLPNTKRASVAVCAASWLTSANSPPCRDAGFL